MKVEFFAYSSRLLCLREEVLKAIPYSLAEINLEEQWMKQCMEKQILGYAKHFFHHKIFVRYKRNDTKNVFKKALFFNFIKTFILFMRNTFTKQSKFTTSYLGYNLS